MTSEKAKMDAGVWYNCIDDTLEELRIRARAAVHEHNTMHPNQRGSIGPALRQLFASSAPDAIIEAPFHCSYGMNISLGAGVYLNAGCVILDSAPVNIGSHTLLGPSVQIYCAEHHSDPDKRAEGLEIARPVSIGERAWIGGGAILMPGVTIGAGAIVGAGSIVTRDVANGATVVGNPAKPIRPKS